MKEFKGKSGIYKITNKINNKVYIGKTKCFYKRYCQYVSDFKRKDKNRINEYLLASMCKHGFDCFTFSVVEFCDISICSERELFWIIHHQSTEQDKGYNLRLDTGTGMVVSPLTSQKISNRLKTEWSNGTRNGHSDKMKTNWETRDRVAQATIMRSNLTRYKYIVYFDQGTVEISYKELVELGMKNVLSSFIRKNSNKVMFKGVSIERVLL